MYKGLKLKEWFLDLFRSKEQKEKIFKQKAKAIIPYIKGRIESAERSLGNTEEDKDTDNIIKDRINLYKELIDFLESEDTTLDSSWLVRFT